MTRKTVIFIMPVLILGACSLSCSDQFKDTNAHLLDTAQIVYEHRSLGNITADEALVYKNKVEEAYFYTVDGSALCEVDEDGAADKFEAAEDILDAIDGALSVGDVTEKEGE